MAQVSFASGTTILTFSNNPVYPVRRPIEAAQVYGETESGELYVYDKGVKIKRHELDFKRMSEADLMALKNFVENEISFGLNPFTYNDEDGVAHQVRLESPIFDFEEDFLGLFSGRLILREEL